MNCFIVFEGIDGCGKSTQAKLFAEKLFSYNKYSHVLLTREPYDCKEIRRRLEEEKDPYSNAELMADLYIDDRKMHLTNLIIPNIKENVNVVSDRYKMSTIAYQSTQGLDMMNLIKRHEYFLRPDITFLIDVPVSIALKRTEGKEKKFEGNEPFQEKLRENYLTARTALLPRGEKISIIDGNKSIDEVSDDVWDIWKLFSRNLSD